MNQYEQRRGVPGIAGSDKEETPGGKAVKYYTSMRVRLEVRKVVLAKTYNNMTGEDEERPVANVVRAIAVKNKGASPFKQAQFYIEFGRGIDNIRTMFELAEAHGFLEKGGAGNMKLILPSGKELKAKGEQNLIKLLRQDKAFQEELSVALHWNESEAPAEPIS